MFLLACCALKQKEQQCCSTCFTLAPASGPCRTGPIMALLLAAGVMRHTAAYAAMLFVKL